MSTFVSVGNATQSFQRLLDAVCEIAANLPQPVVVQYGSLSDFNCKHCQCVAFMDMQEFESQVAEADLLILHAGAGSVINAIKAGKVPIVMPRRVKLGEHIDDHQLEFARELSKAGSVVLCEDTSFLSSAVTEALSRQSQNKLMIGYTKTPGMVGMIRSVLLSRSAK
jgi:UDP-N-acetylglucosamine transferase subunit ALG13